MEVAAGVRIGRAILSAFSERLVVSTMHEGKRYRAAFSKGMIVSLLDCAACDRPLGTTWLTYQPDTTIITGDLLTPREAEATASAVREKVPDVPIRIEDCLAEEADWY
jgi:DNA gyrase/topoisomerase IV subunit B